MMTSSGSRILVFVIVTLCGQCSWCEKFSNIKQSSDDAILSTGPTLQNSQFLEVPADGLANLISSTGISTTASSTTASTMDIITPVVKNTTKLYPERYARLLKLPSPQLARSIHDNEVDDDTPYSENDSNFQEQDEEKEVEDPSVPLRGIYSDCFFKLSFQCVQRKLLVFLDRLNRMKSINVFADILTLVRTRKGISGPLIQESDLQARLNPGEATSALSTLLIYNVERFLQSHVLRISLPKGMSASVAPSSSNNARSTSSDSTTAGDTVDISLTKVLEETTGRGKDKKMKKLLGYLMTGLMGKLAFMGPLWVLMLKLKALKALILSKIALMLSLFHLFKGKKGGGGGYGKEVIIVHDSHGGGHEGLTNSAWATGAGGWSGNSAAQWLNSDSYTQGSHTAANDATYAGTDQTYSTGSHNGGWGNTANLATHGWARRSATDPHWVAYRAYIPTEGEERK